MNYKLIFYLASRTSQCEKAAVNALRPLGLNLRDTSFATSPEKLGELLRDAFEQYNTAVLIGGMSSADYNGTEAVLSRALANNRPDELKKLRNPISSADGYLIRKGSQLIIALPDNPDEITAIMQGEIRKYLNELKVES